MKFGNFECSHFWSESMLQKLFYCPKELNRQCQRIFLYAAQVLVLLNNVTAAGLDDGQLF